MEGEHEATLVALVEQLTKHYTKTPGDTRDIYRLSCILEHLASGVFFARREQHTLSTETSYLQYVQERGKHEFQMANEILQ